MVSLTIDGKEIQVPEGTTVLRAAQGAGIDIPTLCDHPELTPYGGCRLCLVDVEGARTLQPSCTLPVMPNMVVKTNTEKVKEARKFILTLIFSERNHFCMYCQVSGGDCELQNAAYAEGMTHWPLQPNYSPFTVDASNPYFVIDNNRCILCRRCVRACAELVGNYTLGIEDRGANSYLVADLGIPVGESTCVSCGTCVQVCPTGAIIDRQSAYTGREKDVTHVKSICTQCSIGCGIDVLSRDNRVVRIDGDWEAPVNNGLLCVRGRFNPLFNDQEVVTTPLVRNSDGLKAATYANAIDKVKNIIQTCEKEGKTIGALISPKLTGESINQFSQLFKGMKNVRFGLLDGAGFTNGTSSLESFGKESQLSSIDEADCIIAMGSDLAKDHQVIGFLVKRNLPRGTKLILVDNDKSNEFAPFADALINPGDNYSNVLMNIVDSVSSKKMDQASEIGKAASYIKSSEKVALIVGNISTNEKPGTIAEKVKSLANSIESLSKSFSAVSLKGHANSYLAFLLGLTEPVNLTGIDTVLIFQGEDEISQKLTNELVNIPNIVVHSTYTSNLTTKAQVVLPAPSWSEIEGTYLNIDGRTQKANRIIASSEDTKATSQIMSDLADSFGIKLNGLWNYGLNDSRINLS